MRGMSAPGPAAKSAAIVWAVVATFVVVALLGIGAMFLGGSKTRNLFGASADALAGPESVVPVRRDAGSELQR